MQAEQADRLRIDHQRETGCGADAACEKARPIARRHIGVVGDVVPQRRPASAQRYATGGAACRRIGGHRHCYGVQVGDARPLTHDPLHHAVIAQHAYVRASKVADLHGDPTNLLEQGVALTQAHQRRIDAARKMADPRQARDARAVLELLGHVAREAVDALGAAVAAAHQLAARVDPALAAGRHDDAVIEIERLAIVQAAPRAQHCVAVTGMDLLLPQVGIEQQRLRLVAEHFLRRRASVDHFAGLRVDRP